MLHARSAHAVVGVGGSIYALAGSGASGPMRQVERFDGTRWTNETSLPGGGLNAPAAVVLAGHIYVIGGFEGLSNVPTSAVHVYDAATKQWREAAPLSAPRGGHAAVVVDGKTHVIGGGNSQSTIADHSVYDPAADRWADGAPLPRAEGSPAASSSVIICTRSAAAADSRTTELSTSMTPRRTRGRRALPSHRVERQAPSCIAARSSSSAASRSGGTRQLSW
jgi:hypothetical protein